MAEATHVKEDTGEVTRTGGGEAEEGEAGVEAAGDRATGLTEAGIQAALRQEVGGKAETVEWRIRDFTTRGDNYVAEVTSVEVIYRLKNGVANASATNTRNSATSNPVSATNTPVSLTSTRKSATNIPVPITNTTAATIGNPDSATSSPIFAKHTPVSNTPVSVTSTPATPTSTPIPRDFHQTSYVVKLRRGDSDFEKMAFSREMAFYTKVAPLVDDVLIKHGLPPLRTPRCFHSTSSQLFMDNLRSRGFRMADRRKSLNLNQARLVVEEVGRLHASSSLLLNSDFLPSCLQRLASPPHAYSNITAQTLLALLNGSLVTAAEVAREAGREDMYGWFSEAAPRAPHTIAALATPTPPYDVITHGDCWINNLLFREDENGTAVEVALLDFQLCCRSTPAYDLNYLLYSSMEAKDRTHHLPSLLAAYHASFASVMQAAGRDVPFSLAELTREFQNKNFIGVVYGALAIPVLLCDPSDAQEFTVGSKEETLSYMERKRASFLRMLHTNPLLRPRLESLYCDVNNYIQAVRGRDTASRGNS